MMIQCCSFLVFAFSLLCCLTFTIRGHSIKNISITVVSDSSNSKRAASKLYVTVKFTCKCPKCGAVKSFNETLCSGEVSASNYSTNDTTVSTEKLVNDYLMGIIHF